MTRTIFIAAALALAVTLPAIPAQAQAARTFVSAAGSDSNNCTNVATPCRHFAAAYAATAPEGEIDVLDPANYGALTISQGISVQGHGWASVSAVTGGAAITINGGDKINISGVILDGGGANGNGIVFNSGGSLTVTDSVVRNFSSSGPTTGDGILIQPTSGTISFVITNTVVSNNGRAGIIYLPPSGSATATGVIDRVVATNNSGGIVINTSTGGGSTTAAISNSIASNNGSDGIFVINNSAALAVSIDNTGVSGNFNGIDQQNTAKVTLGRSVITANSNAGIASVGNNTFFSYKDNRINENVGADIVGALNYTVTLQ
jgi:hypothetical protein